MVLNHERRDVAITRGAEQFIRSVFVELATRSSGDWRQETMDLQLRADALRVTEPLQAADLLYIVAGRYAVARHPSNVKISFSHVLTCCPTYDPLQRGFVNKDVQPVHDPLYGKKQRFIGQYSESLDFQEFARQFTEFKRTYSS